MEDVETMERKKAELLLLLIFGSYCTTGIMFLIFEQDIKIEVLKDSIIYHSHGRNESVTVSFPLEKRGDYIFVFYVHGVTGIVQSHVVYRFEEQVILDKNITVKPNYSGGTLERGSFNYTPDTTGICEIKITMTNLDRWHLTVYREPPMELVSFFELDHYLIMVIVLLLVGGFTILMIGLGIAIRKSA